MKCNILNLRTKAIGNGLLENYFPEIEERNIADAVS